MLIKPTVRIRAPARCELSKKTSTIPTFGPAGGTREVGFVPLICGPVDLSPFHNEPDTLNRVRLPDEH